MMQTPEPLDESLLDADPMVQFRRWFDDAVQAGAPEPHAMILATAAAAWQCVAAVDALRKNQYDAATISVVGCNEQAIAAQFVNAAEHPE